MQTPDPGTRRVSLLVAVASLLAISAGCAKLPPEEPTVAAAAPDASLIRLDENRIRIAGIRLDEVVPGPLEKTMEVSGRVTFNENATARAAAVTEGMVVSCCESVGADVKKGQVLARIYSHEVHDARASYHRASVELEQRQAELRFAAEFHRRAARLHQLKAGSLQDVEEAEKKLRHAETSVVLASVGQERAVHHLRMLGVTPGRIAEGPDEDHQARNEDADLVDVRSPTSGTIIERTIRSGAVVKPSDSLYVISDLSTLWVIAQAPEQHLPSLRTGMVVDVSVQAYPGRTFPARITYIADALDPATRTVAVRCELRNSDRLIKTEMFATVTIRVRGGEEGLAVPMAALQALDGAEVVFVPEGEHSFRVRRVQAGRHFGSTIEIVNGLRTGERVVVAGALHLKSALQKERMIEQ